MLVDSDVLIWRSRGHAGASKRLRSMPAWRISVVTYMEFTRGCRDKLELARLKRVLQDECVEVLQISEDVSQQAAVLIDDLALSHGLGVADALIGATAIMRGLPLLSANAKHFRPMRELMLEVFSP